MTKSDTKYPRSLTRNGKEVKIYRTSGKDGGFYYTVVYYVGTVRRRVNRKSLAAAESLAKERLEAMVKGRVPVSLEPRDWELLKDLKKAAKDRSPWRLIEDVKAASRVLGGAASLTEAAEFWKARHAHRGSADLTAVFDEYLRHVESRSSERNLRDARNRVGRFEESFRGNAMGDIDESAIRTFLESLKVEPRTRNNYRAQIVSFFRWAQRRGYLEEGRRTAPEVVEPWKVVEKEVSIFTVAQARMLFTGIRKDVEAYAAIAAFAGLRPSEIQRLTWGAIDFKEGYIHVTAEVAKKVNRARYVPLSDNLRAWLEPHRLAAFEKVCFYKAPEILSKDAIGRKVVESWPPDVLRHSFCSYRLAQTKEIGRVAEEAGNSASIIRRHYRRPVTDSAAKKYFEILPGGRGDSGEGD